MNIIKRNIKNQVSDIDNVNIEKNSKIKKLGITALVVLVSLGIAKKAISSTSKKED
ncbi:MAG: hypothetical protein KID00_14560 [Clostridium argentinense]|uniref:Uncharacterized protein n=1 Tax=Clostridium faecium TaxID=2762223 RepID=A0ABR8YQK7_9CLOT|nr:MULTISPECIES: hypothetical protein [Clostridium]MBD8046530.1 hypothetical protein [Clostridium faecium]MBS5825045.1 hypothetical protein [Clostridium argentinense]MDU1349156.1 hypothetical protein [Clostridium argentinense]